MTFSLTNIIEDKALLHHLNERDVYSSEDLINYCTHKNNLRSLIGQTNFEFEKVSDALSMCFLGKVDGIGASIAFHLVKLFRIKSIEALKDKSFLRYTLWVNHDCLPHQIPALKSELFLNKIAESAYHLTNEIQLQNKVDLLFVQLCLENKLEQNFQVTKKSSFKFDTALAFIISITGICLILIFYFSKIQSVNNKDNILSDILELNIHIYLKIFTVFFLRVAVLIVVSIGLFYVILRIYSIVQNHSTKFLLSRMFKTRYLATFLFQYDLKKYSESIFRSVKKFLPWPTFLFIGYIGYLLFKYPEGFDYEKLSIPFRLFLLTILPIVFWPMVRHYRQQPINKKNKLAFIRLQFYGFLSAIQSILLLVIILKFILVPIFQFGNTSSVYITEPFVKKIVNEIKHIQNSFQDNPAKAAYLSNLPKLVDEMNNYEFFNLEEKDINKAFIDEDYSFVEEVTWIILPALFLFYFIPYASFFGFFKGALICFSIILFYILEIVLPKVLSIYLYFTNNRLISLGSFIIVFVATVIIEWAIEILFSKNSDCPNCLTSNTEDSAYCSECGKYLKKGHRMDANFIKTPNRIRM
jgi:hypothetical protein